MWARMVSNAAGAIVKYRPYILQKKINHEALCASWFLYARIVSAK